MNSAAVVVQQVAEASNQRPHDMGDLLERMAQVEASDLFLTVGVAPTYKIEGRLVPHGTRKLAGGEARELAYSVMTDSQIASFERELECDLAITAQGLGRFRCNVYMQRGEVGMVVRHVKGRIPSVNALRLPKAVEDLAMLRQGLVLVVGAAGSGKSTTLAAMLEHRNQRLPGHILTVEDPVEYLHEHGRCIVDQREVGIDTRSFGDALRHALREAPDVIMIGEIRDEETMRHALHYAETGHLCVSTLHANNATQAVERVINFFPENARRQVLMDLALNLRGVVALRLLESSNGRRVPATEVMLWSAFVQELIQKGQIDELKSAIAKAVESGMRSFDQSLFELYQKKEITLQQALDHADSKTDLSLRIRLSAGLPPVPTSGHPTIVPTTAQRMRGRQPSQS